MFFRAKSCFSTILSIPKHSNLPLFTIKQHRKKEMLSPLLGNVLINEINDNSNKSLFVRNPSERRIPKKVQEQTEFKIIQGKPQPTPGTVTIRQHLKDEVVSSLSGNIFVNAEADNKKANDDTILKADVPELFQTEFSSIKANEKNMSNDQNTAKNANKLKDCSFVLSPQANSNRPSFHNTANIKEHFKTNSPLSGKICVALQVRFQLKNDGENKGDMFPKCFQKPCVNSNNLKICAPNENASKKSLPCDNPCKPKPK